MHALRIKNTVLRYWPTKVVNGVEVMDRLFLYVRHWSPRVPNFLRHRKLLPLLGTSREELGQEEWEGLKEYWLYWQRLDLDYNILVDEIKSYIETHSILDGTGFSPWETAIVTYNPMRAVAANASDAEIIQHLNTAESDVITFNTDSHTDIDGDIEFVNRLLGITLLDKNNLLFEKQYIIKNKKIGKRNQLQSHNGVDYILSTGNIQSSVILKANIEVRYRRKAEVDLLVPAIVTLLNNIKKRVEAIDNPEKMWDTLLYDLSTSARQRQNVASKENSINATLKNMYIDTVPVTEDDVNYPYLFQHYIKKSGLENIPAKEFVSFFARSMKTGYKEESAEWYEKLAAIVLAIIIVVVAVFTGLGATALTSLGGLVGASASTVFLFASAFALAISVGVFIVQGLAMLAGEAGLHAFAVYLGKVANFLGVVSTIAGFVSIYAAFKVALAKQVATEVAETALEQAGEEVTSEAIEVALKDVVIKEVAISEVGLSTLVETAKTMLFGSAKLSMMDIVNKTVSAVNWTSNYFMQADLAALQGDLTAQQEKADELKMQYEHYKGSVDKVHYKTSDLYDGYYNPYFNDFELSTGEGPDRIWATKAHWRCQNSIDWLYK
jgi:hypothetical protein